MLQTLIRRAAQEAPYKPYLNPWKAKKTWPPDFTHLSQKHQFRLERRYRRRAKLAWARPRWTKFVKLATWASISVVAVYGILFMDTPGHKSIYEEIRGWYEEGSDHQIPDNTPIRQDVTTERADPTQPDILKDRRSVGGPDIEMRSRWR